MTNAALHNSRYPLRVVADELLSDPKHCLIDIPGLSLGEMFELYKSFFSFQESSPSDYFPPWWENPIVREIAAEKTLSVLRPQFREEEVTGLEEVFTHPREAVWVALYFWEQEKEVFLPPTGLRVGKPFSLRPGNSPLFTMWVGWSKRNRVILVPEPLE